MRPKLALAALAAVTLVLPDTRAQAGPPPWNRRLDTLGIVPTPGQPGHFDISGLWTVELGGPNSVLLHLGTEVALEINGVEVERSTSLVEVTPLSGNCGACAPGCGSGAVNGMAMAMLCLPSAPGTCCCQFPPLTGNFHSQVLKPGDDISVILYPVPGSLPEFKTSDDQLKQTFKGPLLWDRQIVKVEAKPAAGAPAGFFDVYVDWTLGSVGVLDPMLVSPQFGVFKDGFKDFVYVGPCGPWIIAPSNGCAPCTGGTCATITCNGSVVSTSICEESPDGTYCGCFPSSLFHNVIPGVKLGFGQKLAIQMEALPGSLPELPTLAMDDLWEVASPYGEWKDLGKALGGTHGDPWQLGEGSLLGGDSVSITLGNALENSPAFLLAGTKLLGKSFKGGVMVPDPAPPAALLSLVSGPFGKLKLQGAWPLGLPSGFTLYLQWWIQDAAGPSGFSASNALSATTP